MSSMFGSVSLLLIVLWLFGLVTSFTLGGAIHVLPVMALVALIIHLVRSRGESA